jgi:hypothetical protein
MPCSTVKVGWYFGASKQNLFHVNFFFDLFFDQEYGDNMLLAEHQLVFTGLHCVNSLVKRNLYFIGACWFFSSPRHPDQFWGSPNLLFQMVLGTLLWWVKQLGHEADQLPPTSAKVKNTLLYTSTPPYPFMAKCLISEAHRHFTLLSVISQKIESHKPYKF